MKNHGLKEISNEAFYNCKGLSLLSIGNNVTTIGSQAFYGCESLNSLTIPDSVESVGYMAFFGCRGLISLSIGEGVTTIGNYAFSDCSDLPSVKIPDNVTSIGKNAFSGCTSLTTVAIGKGVTSIGSYAFYNCRINSVRITDIVAWCKIKFGDFLVLANHLYVNGEKISDLVIPNGLDSISDRAFLCCNSLTSVTLPNSIISIGNSAFEECENLRSVHIPNSVTSIGNYAFYSCSKLTTVNIPDNVSSIGDYAFSGCVEMKSLSIPNNLTDIGSHSFGGCGISSVSIPNSVISIGESAFNSCRNLTSVKIPNSVTTIGESAFYGCVNLSSLSIPEHLKIIKKGTFCYCESLKSITIPASVEYIYQQAFANCSNLKQVIVLSETPPFAYDNSFSNYNVTLKIPEISKTTYKSTEPWSWFEKIEAINPTKYVLSYYVDGVLLKTYEIEEGETITKELEPTKEGYTFSGWSNIPETMPANDVTVTGTFAINTYQVTYMIGNDVFRTDSIQYGAKIQVPDATEIEGYTFDGWADVPETMPAQDIIIYGSYTSGISDVAIDDRNLIINDIKGRRIPKLQRGVNIIRTRDGRTRKVMVK